MKKGKYERRLKALDRKKQDLAGYEARADVDPLAANADKIQMVRKEIATLEERINAERPIQTATVEDGE